MSIVIVPYDESYKDSLFDFTDSCFKELGKVFEPSGRHSFYGDIDSYFEVFYCLLDDGQVKGSVALKRTGDDVAELKCLYLASELRGKGFGHQLMSKVISAAASLGYGSIVLDSMSQYQDAIRLYRRMGFEDTDRYNDNPYADVFMRLELKGK